MGVAHERSIPLEGVRVRVTRKQNIDGIGPYDPRQRQLRVTQFRRHIYVKGPLSQEHLDALLWGAEHCPVSNTLEGAVPIVSRIQKVEE